MKISDYVKAKRIERGLSQRELASILGVSNSYISYLEDGRYGKLDLEANVPLLYLTWHVISAYTVSKERDYDRIKR